MRERDTPQLSGITCRARGSAALAEMIQSPYTILDDITLCRLSSLKALSLKLIRGRSSRQHRDRRV
jgi:hypothetical protein